MCYRHSTASLSVRCFLFSLGKAAVASFPSSMVVRTQAQKCVANGKERPFRIYRLSVSRPGGLHEKRWECRWVSNWTVRLLSVAQSTKRQLKSLRNKMLTRRVYWALNKDR